MTRGNLSRGQARAALTIFDKTKADAWLDAVGNLRVACRGDRVGYVRAVLGDPAEMVSRYDPASGGPKIVSLVYRVTR